MFAMFFFKAHGKTVMFGMFFVKPHDETVILSGAPAGAESKNPDAAYLTHAVWSFSTTEAPLLYSPSMRRRIEMARPVAPSHSTNAAHMRGSPLAASNFPGIPLRNRARLSSFSTPMTLSKGPLMPTSVW
jgi:hypothetical protein